MILRTMGWEGEVGENLIPMYTAEAASRCMGGGEVALGRGLCLTQVHPCNATLSRCLSHVSCRRTSSSNPPSACKASLSGKFPAGARLTAATEPTAGLSRGAGSSHGGSRQQLVRADRGG